MKAHDTAIRLLNQDRISNEEKLYIFQNYRADANHITSKTGAFFTPLGLAKAPSFAILEAASIIIYSNKLLVYLSEYIFCTFPNGGLPCGCKPYYKQDRRIFYSTGTGP